MEKQLLISHDKISLIVRNLANKINEDYKGQSVVFVGILNGCFMFFSDLMKQINLECEVDFVSVRSYNKDVIGEIQLLKDITTDIEDKVVIVVDDILDSGKTAAFVHRLLRARLPREIKFCFMLAKELSAIGNSNDYIGAAIQSGIFVYGYGLDRDKKDRNLNEIYYYNR